LAEQLPIARGRVSLEGLVTRFCAGDTAKAKADLLTLGKMPTLTFLLIVAKAEYAKLKQFQQ